MIIQVTLLQRNQQYQHDLVPLNLQGFLVSLEIQEPLESQVPLDHPVPQVHLDFKGPLDLRDIQDLLELQASHLRAGTHDEKGIFSENCEKLVATRLRIGG